jgi:hypothetical protein
LYHYSLKRTLLREYNEKKVSVAVFCQLIFSALQLGIVPFPCGASSFRFAATSWCLDAKEVKSQGPDRLLHAP